jgi:UDP-N-acetyl-D-galactosamine dehydrogenase
MECRSLLFAKGTGFGYHPEIILAGRRLNDSMADYVASQIVKLMIKKGISVNKASLLMLGITLKKTVLMFGTKIINVIKALTDYGIVVSTYDPVAKTGGSLQGIWYKTYKEIPAEKYDAVVLGVSHTSFLSLDITSQKPLSVVYDIKGILGEQADGRL